MMAGMRKASLLLCTLLAACGSDSGASGPDAAPGDASAAVPDGAASGTDAGACPRSPLAAGDHDVTVTHDGVDHVFHIHVPAGLDLHAPAPVVLFFHGGGGTADGQELIVQLVPFADAHGFVLVRGEGYETVGGVNGEVWNAGSCCGIAADNARAIDHVGAVRAFLDVLEAKVCVDPKRVFATGHSNGGMLAYRLGCELADRVAAIAPNAAFLMNRDLDATPQPVTLFDCAPARPVPVLHLHGLADLCAPFGGGSSNGLDPATRPTVQSGIDVFRARNGCADTPTTTYSQGMASCSTWGGCAEGADITLCTIGGAGHTWAGAPYRPATQMMCGGTGTMDLDANSMIWDFFVAHPMP
jgi:polyhydroxybutyrate depolymerase